MNNEFLKKLQKVLYKERLNMIEKTGNLSVRHQCKLLKINRSSLFYRKKMPNKDAEICKKINELHVKIPFYGYRKITHKLRRQGTLVNLKKIQRVMRIRRRSL